MTYACNICRNPLVKTGEVVVCPRCGARYTPYERTTLKDAPDQSLTG